MSCMTVLFGHLNRAVVANLIWGQGKNFQCFKDHFLRG